MTTFSNQENRTGPTFETVNRAAFGYRIFALIYDTLIVVAIWMITIILLVTFTGRAWTGAWVQSMLFIILFAYVCYCWMHKRQTIGMLAWRLRIECEGPFTLRQALLRFIGEILSLSLLGFGYLWIGIDSNRKSWSDLLSNSYVVRYRLVSTRFAEQPPSTTED